MGGLRRAMRKLQSETLQELLSARAESAIVTILYEALPASERSAMTEDEFADILPVDIQGLAGLVVNMLGAQNKRPPAESTTELPVQQE
jgi:hypothetical protein